MMPERVQRCAEGVLTLARILLVAGEDVRHQRLVGVTAEAEAKIRGEGAECVGHPPAQTHQGLLVVLHRPCEIHEIVEIQGIIPDRTDKTICNDVYLEI